MARLKLKDGVTYGDVGDIVARLAGEAQSNVDIEASATINDFKALIDEELETVSGLKVNEVSLPSVPTAEKDSVFVNFHFDKTITDSNRKVRIVNIVIPDFNDKLTSIVRQGALHEEGAWNYEDPELERSLADLSQVAKEAFGFIVICGCVG